MTTMATGGILNTGNITLSATGSAYSSTSAVTIAGGNYSYAYNQPILTASAATYNSSASLEVQGDTNIKGNLIVNGNNISDMLVSINQRLAILVPDPKRLAKYEALQQAYEHYKILEALCIDETNSDT